MASELLRSGSSVGTRRRRDEGPRRAAWWVLVLGLLFACRERESTQRSRVAAAKGEAAEPVDSAAPSASAASLGSAARPQIRDVLTRHECSRCHAGPGLTESAPDKQCVGCHQRIEAGDFDVDAATLRQWQDRIVHFLDVPSLWGVERLRADYLRDFFERPHDVRPGLAESMPRLALSAAEREVLASLGDEQPVRRSPGDAAAPVASWRSGLDAYRAHGCSQCHRYTGVTELLRDNQRVPSNEAAARRAPDLRFARRRMSPEMLRRWLRDPRSLKRDTSMPAPRLQAGELEQLVALLLDAPLAPDAHRRPAPRLPLLTRSVTFDEVAQRVFHDSCWHCHAEPSFARGDGGPGNTGGFGFAGASVNLSSYESSLAGYRSAAGARVSLFKPDDSGMPRLLHSLLARRDEEQGVFDDAIRGMPLGMPSLSDRDIQLVESWIAQGRPR